MTDQKKYGDCFLGKCLDIIPSLEKWSYIQWERKNEQPLQLFVSPSFRIKGSTLYVFEISLSLKDQGGLKIGFVNKRIKWLEILENPRSVSGKGQIRIIIPLRVSRSCEIKLCAMKYFSQDPLTSLSDLISNFKVTLYENQSSENSSYEVNTELSHWNWRQRLVHNACKHSKFFNTLVAAYEMRKGKEELLSLPQYSSLCPTGQCNASCSFCSVTINRTGIIKKQMPFDKVWQFLAPIGKTIRMYGLEGNGEPTLYREFPKLVKTLTEQGSPTYLITNGSRLTKDYIELLVAHPVPSINFSLNAATAETHKAVMKLKEFDSIVSAIKRLVNLRGENGWPTIYVSFVVTRDNIHEVQTFLAFAEYELKVDVIMIRPLSELGGDLGVVEDFRTIVPFESDINDMVECVNEYISDVQRRTLFGESIVRSSISFDPASFRSYKSVRSDDFIFPRGFEDRLLPPRRQYWNIVNDCLMVRWHLNTVSLTCNQFDQQGEFWKSDFISVPQNKSLLFKLCYQLQGNPIKFSIRDMHNNEIINENMIRNNNNSWTELSLTIQTDLLEAVQFVFESEGQPFNLNIDFERVRTPLTIVNRVFQIPNPKRWSIESHGVSQKWIGSRQQVVYEGNSGPYLVKSYTIPCMTQQAIEFPLCLTVKKGILVIGILNETFSKFITQAYFEKGKHETIINFNTEENRHVQIVFSASQTPLEVEIDWGTIIDGDNVEVNELNKIQINVIEPFVEEMRPSAQEMNVANQELTEKIIEEPKTIEHKQKNRNKIKYFCQKPWTDLNNFSVDGRVDVCCIATGPSQERFALGNMLTNSFQEVWNGERMREFRRTVNHANPELHLPPCQRCPLAYKYQGPFFDPKLTPSLAHKEIMDIFLPLSNSWLNGMVTRIISPIVFNSLNILNKLYFAKGFKTD